MTSTQVDEDFCVQQEHQERLADNFGSFDNCRGAVVAWRIGVHYPERCKTIIR
jgi:hypothetical protein